MMRSEESAKQLAETIFNNDEAADDISNTEEDDDVLYRSSEELTNEYGDRWLTEQTNSDGRHTTQVKNTLRSYEKFGEWVERDSNGREVSVLDASSGLGLGTEHLRNMGMDVEDVEPYPSADRIPPTYSSYSQITKKYDYIISNAVLNVIPDDWRKTLLHQMADKLKIGGKLVINVRSAESIKNQGTEGKTRITLDDESEILVLRPNGSIKAYQKGFTKQELKSWCEKELGEGYSVEIANNNNAGGSYDTAVVITKNNENRKKLPRRTILNRELNTYEKNLIQEYISDLIAEGFINDFVSLYLVDDDYIYIFNTNFNRFEENRKDGDGFEILHKFDLTKDLSYEKRSYIQRTVKKNIRTLDGIISEYRSMRSGNLLSILLSSEGIPTVPTDGMDSRSMGSKRAAYSGDNHGKGDGDVRQDLAERSGEGAVSDEGVTIASDPVSKAIGEPRYGRGKKMREYAERQRRFMVQKVQEVAQKLNLDNVEIVTDTSTLLVELSF